MKKGVLVLVLFCCSPALAQVCDIDGDGEIRASEALAVLQASVGLSPALCDGPGTTTTTLPSTRYENCGDGTVADLFTGLRWEKKVLGSGCTHCVEDQWSWYDAQFWIADVNSESFAGYSDWRLPKVDELRTILKAPGGIPPGVCDFDPCVDPIIGWTSNKGHWSNTTSDSDPDWAWRVLFRPPSVIETNPGTEEKFRRHHVRAVRNGFCAE
jgi:hypothetical protein